MVVTRLPMSILVFLLALAPVNDIGALLVIGTFYSHHLDFLALWL
jgi:Na+/H+ antiporter NhaA